MYRQEDAFVGGLFLGVVVMAVIGLGAYVIFEGDDDYHCDKLRHRTLTYVLCKGTEGCKPQSIEGHLSDVAEWTVRGCGE